MRPLAAYRLVLPYLARFRREFLLVVAAGLVASVATLAQPWLTRDLIDKALLEKNWAALVRVACLLVVVTAVGFVLNGASSYWYTKLSAGVLFDMRLALFCHLQTLPPQFFARTKMGEIVSRLNNDLGEVQRITADVLLSILTNSLFLAGAAGIMLWLDWRLFLVGIVVLPFSVLAIQIYQRRLAERVSDLRQRSANLGSYK